MKGTAGQTFEGLHNMPKIFNAHTRLTIYENISNTILSFSDPTFLLHYESFVEKFYDFSVYCKII